MDFSFKKNKQTAVRGKSSALLVTTIVHVVLFVVAGMFVAMEVIDRQEAKFEGKQINRPKMKLKKLQLPVQLEKKVKQQAPKLSQRVTANSSVKTKSVDFKMPDIAGFGGSGLGGNLSDDGLGIGSLGFASTQLNVFGLKSSGEKILFILDTYGTILKDEIGGIPAYTIIKNELVKLISSLPPTALFNLIVYDRREARAFSKERTAATDGNVESFKKWIEPLNAFKEKYGFKSIKGGYSIPWQSAIPIGNTQPGLYRALGYAALNGVDSVNWLGADEWMVWPCREYYNLYRKGRPMPDPSGWPEEYRGEDGWFDIKGYGYERWEKKMAEANKLYDQECKDRLAKGQPVRVISDGRLGLFRTYFPAEAPPNNRRDAKRYWYKSSDLDLYLENLAKTVKKTDRRAAEIGLKKKKMSFNAIQFVPASDDPPGIPILEGLTRELNGGFRQMKGLAAIRSAVTGR